MNTDSFCFCLQNRLIQTSQTGGERNSDTTPLSIHSMRSMCATSPKVTEASILNVTVALEGIFPGVHLIRPFWCKITHLFESYIFQNTEK
jgi:hypothetical protein